MIDSVQINDRTKGRLEELQSAIEAEIGHTVTKQELLERLVDTVYESRSEFIDSLRDEWDGLSDETIASALSESTASGDVTDEEDIDDVLY